MALVFGAITALAPGAQAAGVVAAGTIQAVSGPGIALHAPPDGRLNGDGFTLAVSGYCFAYMVGSGVSARYAAPGQVLLVFGFTGTGSSVEATLMVDGQGQAMPDASTSGSATPLYFLTSVPVGAKDVALAVSADGFSQTFSFTKGRREGPHPTVLYASKGHWEQVDSIASTTNIPTPDRVNDLDAGVTVQITSATLTYFLPGTAATPPSPSKAWLVLSGSALPYNAAPGGPNDDSNEDYQKTLPPSDFTLTLPGATPMAAMLTGQGGPDDESGNTGGLGLMGGDYYWEVPADLRTATLQVHLPAELLAQPGHYSGHWGSVAEVQVEGIIPSTPVAFAPVAYQPSAEGSTNPPPWAPKPAAGSAPGSGHLKTASTKLMARASSVSGTLFVLIGLVVVLLAVLGVIGYRGHGRRRIIPALARITGSPADRTAADVAAFLPSTGAAGPKPARETAEPTKSPSGAPAIATMLPKPMSPSPARSTLISVPEEPAPLPKGAIEVQMIGTVGLAGALPEGADELNESLIETLAALAQNSSGGPMSREALRALLGTGRDSEWSAGTISTYVNGLRRVFGTERVPDGTSGGGYRVVGIGTDIDRLHKFVAAAKAEPKNAAGHLADALSLVRGVPFSGVPNRSYGWANRHDLGDITTNLTNSIHKAATDLAQLSIDGGDHELATWATDKGLLLWEFEDDLNELALSAAAISPDRSALALSWAAVERRFGAPRDPVPDRLQGHYERLKGQN